MNVLHFVYTPPRRVDTLFGSPEKAAGVADDKGMSLAARAKNIISSCKTNEDDDSWLFLFSLLFPLCFLPSFRELQSLFFEILWRRRPELLSDWKHG